MGTPIIDAKRALRAQVRAQRDRRPDSARARAAEGIAAQLDALVTRQDARSLSCYLSTPSEPGTRPFLTTAAGRGIRVLLPVSRSDGLLDWARADGGVAEGLFGLTEPTGPRQGPYTVGDVDLMIIPAAAVDRAGTRLGWGRGYFDRAIGALARVPPIYGVVYDAELVDEIPRDLHDQPVTGVVTPTHTLELAPVGR